MDDRQVADSQDQVWLARQGEIDANGGFGGAEYTKTKPTPHCPLQSAKCAA